jgi:glycosyltransferase involved in cell wall biosynthesis
MKPFRILALFDFNSFTGFATVSKNLVYYWEKNFGDDMLLDIVAINYFGDNYSPKPNIRVISGKRNDVAKDDFGRYVFMRSLMDLDYDIVFILQDLGVVVPMIPEIRKIREEKKANNKKSFKSILYFPVDFDLTPNLVVGLEFFDRLATFTQWGKAVVLSRSPRLREKITVIPHGNNPKDFYGLSEDQKADFRKDYFGDNASKFIVGCVNRNQSRKDIPSTIFAFMEYKKEYNQDAFLYLHMNPYDPMGWNLKVVLAQTWMREGVDYMFPSEQDYSFGSPVEKLNKIYNSFDLFLSTTTGEGWGLSITEAMACGIPIVAPNHTSIKDISNDGDRIFPTNNHYPIVSLEDNIIRYQSDIYEVADTMWEINKDLINGGTAVKQKTAAAKKFLDGLHWRTIADVFIAEIKKLL